MQKRLTAYAQTYATLIARLLLGLFFIISGYSKMADIPGVVRYIENASTLPAPQFMAIASAALEIYGGLAILFGFSMPFATASLFVFTLLATYFFHHPSLWAKNPLQQLLFMKNLGVAAGLLYMFAYGAGNSWTIGHLSRSHDKKDDTPTETTPTDTPTHTEASETA